MFRIRIAEDLDFNPEVIHYLKSFAEVTIESCTQDEIETIFKEYDVFWFRLGFRIGAKEIGEAPRCSIVATPVTGIDHIDESLCASQGIKIVCLRGEYDFLKTVRATAELTIALTLDLLRQTNHAIEDVQKGNWNRDLFRGKEIYEKKVGIVGLGRLGTIVASLFEAFGAKILYHDVRSVKNAPSFTFVSRIEDLIERSDIVSIHVNYTESNYHLFNRTLFSSFNGKQYLINTSRGGLIEELALIEALENGNLRGVALDVVQDEHTWNKDNTLAKYAETHKNLIITPHIGGNTYESFSKTEWFLAKKIKSLVND